jgi:hypothetical protein
LPNDNVPCPWAVLPVAAGQYGAVLRQEIREAITAEQKRNLGYGVYKALQEHGGWRVNPEGWRPYQSVMQFFDPWAATEGPWETTEIKDLYSYQKQRLADQR